MQNAFQDAATLSPCLITMSGPFIADATHNTFDTDYFLPINSLLAAYKNMNSYSLNHVCVLLMFNTNQKLYKFPIIFVLSLSESVLKFCLKFSTFTGFMSSLIHSTVFVNLPDFYLLRIY